MRYLVRAFGFRAEAFSSAQEFLSSSLVEETNCLILDVRMPGMDGLELQRHLANADKRIPIVFITARASDNERRRAMAGGAVDLLLKPFSEDALFGAIQTALTNQ
jgi:FixJ family two-component response regulator